MKTPVTPLIGAALERLGERYAKGFSGATCRWETDLSRDLERQVRQAQSQWHSPAVSAGVVRDGALVWSLHVGARHGSILTAGPDRPHAAAT